MVSLTLQLVLWVHKLAKIHIKQRKSIQKLSFDFFQGGVALVFVGQPLDTMKVKMQTFPTMYRGMLDCFVKTFKSDGFARGLYAGTVPSIVANVAENSVLFAAYGGCQKAVTRLLGLTVIKKIFNIQF